jgi:hypothetical protein
MSSAVPDTCALIQHLAPADGLRSSKRGMPRTKEDDLNRFDEMSNVNEERLADLTATCKADIDRLER